MRKKYENQNLPGLLWGSLCKGVQSDAVRESANKSAASAASPDYVKNQAVIKSAASAASLAEATLAADLITAFFLQFLAALAANYAKSCQNIGLCPKNEFCPKVKSPKMGLSIRPRQFL